MQIRQINKDKYWQESGPLIILQRSTLNGENRHGLLITRVTKTINDCVKRVHGATIIDAPLIYFNIHSTVKNRELEPAFSQFSPNSFLHKWYNKHKFRLFEVLK